MSQTIRVWFAKQGEASYISHLDVQRVMQRALRCAGIPVEYSHGFNPHIALSFSLPLSLGQESLVENFDYKTEEETVDYEDVKNRLNAVMPKGFTITAVRPEGMRINEIGWGRYKIFFSGDAAAHKDEISEFMSRPEITVGKRNKKGVVRRINIAPDIQQVSWTEENGEAVLNLLLPAGIDYNVNPDLLVKAIGEEIPMDSVNIRILRTELLTENYRLFE